MSILEFRFHSLSETELLNMDYHILKSKKKFLDDYDKQVEKEREKAEKKNSNSLKSSSIPRKRF